MEHTRLLQRRDTVLIEGQRTSERFEWGSRTYSVGRDRPPIRPVVYYISWADRIKIGFTTRLAERLRSIYHDEVLAVEPGSLELERTRHQQFVGYRIANQREWFSDGAALRFHINTIRDKYPNLIRSFL